MYDSLSYYTICSVLCYPMSICNTLALNAKFSANFSAAMFICNTVAHFCQILSIKNLAKL